MSNTDANIVKIINWDMLSKVIQNTTFYMNGSDVIDVINRLKDCTSEMDFWNILLDEIHMDGYAEGHDDGKWGMSV